MYISFYCFFRKVYQWMLKGNLFLRLSENWMICENNAKPWIRLSRIVNENEKSTNHINSKQFSSKSFFIVKYKLIVVDETYYVLSLLRKHSDT